MYNSQNIQIGLVASTDRYIKPVDEFRHLLDLGSVQNTQTLVTSRGGVLDTLATIKQVIQKDHTQVRQLAKHLQTNDLKTTLQNNWKWLFEHVGYQLDPAGQEHIKKPLRLISDRVGDCDDYTTFLGSLLTNQGISFRIRMTGYGNGWQHVYIIVPKNQAQTPTQAPLNRYQYYTLDCVLDQFDLEQPPKKIKDIEMNISVLGSTPQQGYNEQRELLRFNSISGLSGVSNNEFRGVVLKKLKEHVIATRDDLLKNPNLQEINDLLPDLNALISNWDNEFMRNQILDRISADSGLNGLRDKIKNFGKAIKNVVQKIPAAAQKAGQFTVNTAKEGLKAVVRYNPISIAIRNGFLLALKLNLFGMSEKLGYAKFTRAEIIKMGLSSSFYDQVQDRYKRTLKMFEGIQGIKKNLDKNINDGWEKGVKKRGLPTLGEPVTAAAGTAAASGFIAKVVSFVKDLDLTKVTTLITSGSNILNTFKKPETPSNPNPERPERPDKPSTPEPKKGMGTAQIALIGGGVLVAGGLLYAFMRKPSLSGLNELTPKTPLNKVEFSI